MYYANGGSEWTNSVSWLNNKSHCTWNGIKCNSISQVTEIMLRHNNLSGSIIDLSALTSINTIALDVNNLAGPIPNSVCAIANIILVVDENLCDDPGTTAGCCDKVRTIGVTIDEIIDDVLGTANCQNITNAADKNACVWMEEELNHPLNDDEAHGTIYLKVSTTCYSIIVV